MNQHVAHLKEAVKNAFGQIEEVLQGLSVEQYSTPSNTLFKASIGQHVRHIIELFTELQKGYETGTIDYEKRKRDCTIETDKYFALQQMEHIVSNIAMEDKGLLLQSGFGNGEEKISMATNYYRELVYNIEHAIHHMALIRVGVNELATIVVDENFGIAPATIKYRQSCVQ
jgi:hypothetical protein